MRQVCKNNIEIGILHYETSMYKYSNWNIVLWDKYVEIITFQDFTKNSYSMHTCITHLHEAGKDSSLSDATIRIPDGSGLSIQWKYFSYS